MSKHASHACGRYRSAGMNRREMLARCATGFGGVALLSMLHDSARGAESPAGPLAVQTPHYPAKVKSVIFLYMDGGPSHVDTFDYKPTLAQYHGQNPHDLFEVERTQFNSVGNVMQSPFAFKQYGECGRWVSDLFPEIATHVDDLAFIHSMFSTFPEHTNANYFLHTGHGIQGRPSMGAWLSYGLGSENQNLPSFVVINGGMIPPGGLDCFGNGFLSAAHQGSVFLPSGQAMANIVPQEGQASLQANKLAALGQLDRGVVDRLGEFDELEAAIANYELAARMQAAVPELTDLSQETEETKRMYGLDAADDNKAIFASECLLARRLVERGVRFIELTCPNSGFERWDQHGNLVVGLQKNCLAVDQPISALLTDLKRTGLWDETLVIWGGEFGRTPFSQGDDGRDHNPGGFTMWMAGGGIQGGVSYGATDEFGYKAVENIRSKFTICTRRCCICSASTTNSSPSTTAAATCV